MRKGFERRNAHHVYLTYVSLEGKKSLANTKTSHGRSTELSDTLIGAMARQCGVTRKQFLALVDCPLDRETYERLLREAGKL